MASARAWVFTVFLLACLLAGPTDGWGSRRRRRRRTCPANTAALPGALNTWDATFTFECPWNKAISRIKSVHCNTAEDRVWRFECQDASGISHLTQHYWTGWINDFDGGMGQNCPFNSVVTGFKSEHSNQHEDRRWKMKCSKKTGMVLHSCYTTGYVNSWDHAMDFTVPVHVSYYVTGMHGYHSNGAEDRLYQFRLCKVTP
ncbi:PREDICTED: hemagglutinin/amebocyte aggregation factor-like [Branchiostoma belcheri]|uniref:Hemagglutinin/amebocyte aggregation factor-like n=1 Tax=Branchiostoma belcheri TaxID=7741 RepID=A0A6P5AWK3_BRABE|nr:PREDICTED: hemagglutinin/amebocyte aggregation factor-like [Branchiostoma belcheri]